MRKTPARGPFVRRSCRELASRCHTLSSSLLSHLTLKTASTETPCPSVLVRATLRVCTPLPFREMFSCPVGLCLWHRQDASVVFSALPLQFGSRPCPGRQGSSLSCAMPSLIEVLDGIARSVLPSSQRKALCGPLGDRHRARHQRYSRVTQTDDPHGFEGVGPVIFHRCRRPCDS